jgi:excisionase family DNA binding protein
MRTHWPNCATRLSSWNSTPQATRAVVLDWRLDDTRLHNSLEPLPWLPGIPDRIANNPDWGPYLAARAQLITDLADQVRASGEAATWADEQDRVLPAGLITDLEVWRAAMQVAQADLRPTGPEQRSLLARTWQHRLNRRLGTGDTPQDQQWAELLTELIPNLIKDSFLPSLTKRLENLDRAGLRREQSRSIGSRQSTVARRPPGSRSVVAHPRERMIMTLQAGERLMSLTEVSEILSIPVHTLYRWRHKGDGPVGYRVGRHVRYRREAVEAWLEQQVDKR